MNNAQSIPSVPILPPRHLPSCRDFVVTKSAICLVSVRSKGGAVVRALTSHQSDPGSNPSVDAWFSPLLQEVFLWVLRFSFLLKNQHFQIPIQPEIR